MLTPLERRSGLPIGNLTSQFIANLYLNSMDHFIKQDFKAKAYLLYCDDFAVFSDDEGGLKQIQEQLAAFLV